MKKQHYLLSEQWGMTLLEVIVTLGVLSVIFMGTLKLYSTTYKTLRTRDSLLNLIHDSHILMSYIGDDIRHAESVKSDFQLHTPNTVVAIIKIAAGSAIPSKEMVVVYSLGVKHPNRLFRSVYIEGKETSKVEISTYIYKLRVKPKTKKLFEVQIILKDQVVGQLSTLQVSSAYAMRL